MTLLTCGPVLLILVAAAFRFPAVRRNPDNPALRAFWLALMLLGIALTVLLAPVATMLDRLLGVPNLARLIGNSLALCSGMSVQALLLLINFEHTVAVRKIRIRCWLLAVALAAMTLLFALAPVDVEAPNFMVVYAGTPFVGEYRVVYFTFLGVALRDVVRLCWRYAHQARRPTMALGLRLTAIGAAFGLLYIAHGVWLVIARRTGAGYLFGQPDTVTEVLVASAAVCIAVGSTMPAWGPRVGLDWLLHCCTAYRTYRRLYPLWNAITEASPEIVLRPPPSHVSDILHPHDLQLRLYRRIIEIRDGCLALRPYLERHAAVMRDRGKATDLSDVRLRSVVEAARIDAAIRNKRQGRKPADHDTEPVLAGGSDVATEAAWLVMVATDFRKLGRRRSITWPWKTNGE